MVQMPCQTVPVTTGPHVGRFVVEPVAAVSFETQRVFASPSPALTAVPDGEPGVLLLKIRHRPLKIRHRPRVRARSWEVGICRHRPIGSPFRQAFRFLERELMIVCQLCNPVVYFSETGFL